MKFKMLPKAYYFSKIEVFQPTLVHVHINVLQSILSSKPNTTKYNNPIC